MPKDLLIEASTSGEFGMQYIIAQQRKPFNSQDDLKVIQWMEIQEEKSGKKHYNLEWHIWETGENTVILLGMNGLLPTGVQMECL